MSIFSRLFNKGQEPETKPGDEAPGTPPQAPEVPAPAAPSATGKPGTPQVPVLTGEEPEADVPTTEHARPDLVQETATKDQASPRAQLQQPPTAREMKVPGQVEAVAKRDEPAKRPAARVPKKASIPPPLPRAARTQAKASQRPAVDTSSLLEKATADTPQVDTPEVDVPEPGTNTRSDISDVRSLFQELAANHMMPVRDFMFEVRAGGARADWLHTYDAAVKAMRRAAEGLELLELAADLDAFGDLLGAAGNATGLVIDGGVRDDLLSAYEKLIARMPNVFGLDAEHSRRETIILNSLLLQVPGVDRTTLDALYASGLNTLDRFLIAAPEEIAAVAGIPDDVATALLDKLRSRRADIARGSMSSLPPPPAPVGPGAPPMPGVRGHPHTVESVDGDSLSIDVTLEPPPSQGSTAARSEPPVDLAALVGAAADAEPAAEPVPVAATRKLPTPTPPPMRTPPLVPLTDAQRTELTPLVAALRAVHERFAGLGEAWREDAASEKRRLRKERVAAADAIEKWLDAAGHAKAAAELHKLSFERKLVVIERCLKP